MYGIINKVFLVLFFNMSFIGILAMEKEYSELNNAPKIISIATLSKDIGKEKREEPKLSAIQKVQQLKASQDHGNDLNRKKRYADLRKRIISRTSCNE